MDEKEHSFVLSIKKLSFEYESGFALKDISADIKSGEKIAVLGANGSGKSTFFLNLNGVLTNHHGDIFYKNIRIDKKNINILRSGVGIVFQEPDSQLIASTVEAEIAFGPLNLGLSETEVRERVEDSLSEMGIESLKEKLVHYLSGGEKKRVTIADILAMKPAVIIFDEPTASLDPLNCDLFEDTLKKLESANTTVIISTHDVDFAWRWAERILVFHNGSILADELPHKIFENDELLKATHLKKPVLLEICTELRKHGILPNNQYVKSVSEFKEMFL